MKKTSWIDRLAMLANAMFLTIITVTVALIACSRLIVNFDWRW